VAGTSVVRVILINILVIIVVAALLLTGYVLYTNGVNYVSSDDAQVTGTMVPITVQYPGKLNSWFGQVNSTLNQGDVIGAESNTSVLQNTPGLEQLVSHSTTLQNRLTDAETIVSPINGTIIQNNATVGQVVQPGQVLAEVVNENDLNVTANIQESDIRHVSVGQTVDVTFDAIPGTTYQGTVSSIGDTTQAALSTVPNLTASSGTYTKVAQRIPVIISLGNGSSISKSLVPGMSANVTIHINNN